ncbi:uncharacterized protein TNCV_3849731 [Trichonephila clavipes]|nr:uncharacterized protein TNCV_3849731 [Trichonephila clavipes]
MKLTEKLISENHRDEFCATSGKPSISPSPLRLTSMHFSDVIPASEKKSNPTRQCSRDRDPVIEIPEISQVKIDQGITDEEVISKINQSIEEKCGRSVFFALDHKNVNVLVVPGYELILTAAEAPRLLTMLSLPREDRTIKVSETFLFRKPSKTKTMFLQFLLEIKKDIS